MPIFRYRSVAEGNQIVEGEMEAPAEAAVVERLRGLGQIPLDASEVTVGSRFASKKRLFALRRVSRRDVFLITHELATLLKAGVPLDRAFETLIDLGENPLTKSLLGKILERLRSGVSFADALGEYRDVFPPYYASMVRAGEASGALDIVLDRLAEFLEKSQKLRETVQTALYYPIFLLIMSIASVVILLSFVVPEFKPLFESAGEALPTSTRILVAVGDFIREYGWLVVVVLGGIFFVVRRYFATDEGRRLWDGYLLRLPLIGTLITKIEVARFSRTASTLLQNGVSLLQALVIVRDTLSNTVMASSIDSVATRLKEGGGLAQPLRETGLYPRLMLHLVRVGEETGKLDDMLAKLADIYDDEVGRTTSRMLALLVPVLTISMGIMIAGIITSILTAIFSVNTLAF
jgi:general secretion pathway protein F